MSDEMRNVGFDRVLTDDLHNVLGVLEGQGVGRDLLLLAHTDHVDVGQMRDPFSGKKIDGEPFGESGPVIYGRGACDMKGALASMVYAVEMVKRSNVELAGNVVVLAFTREEKGEGEGLDYAVENWDLNADMAISGEATGLDVYIGHRGSMQFKIVAKGRSCHASNPARGINAIDQMTKILDRLRSSYRMPSDPTLGHATFAVLGIRSHPGGETPIVPDRCEAIVDRRYFPGETRERLEEELVAVIEELKKEEPDLEAEVRIHKDSRPYVCDSEAEIVNVLQVARTKVLGERSALGHWMFGVDVFAVEDRGIPCAGMGPGKEVFAHTPEDHVSVSDLIHAAEIYAETMVEACKIKE
jgi:succinyl-diaminopimelate desuccinylase